MACLSVLKKQLSHLENRAGLSEEKSAFFVDN